MKKIDLSLLRKPLNSYYFILDIDSTLISTHQRNQAILNQFIAEHQTAYPVDCEKLKQAQCGFGDYGYHSTLKRIQFNPENKETLHSLEKFWRQHFFSNSYLNYDEPMSGAIEWVQQIEKQQIDFVYLTARHHSTMWSGTLESLSKLGFPISENNLYLKKDLTQTDEEYKISVLKSLLKTQADKNICFIDNEPLVLHSVSEKFPEVHLVWFNSTHSGKKQPPEDALEIYNFNFNF